MEKIAIKDLLYGGVNELIHNNKFYRHSPIGYDYCRFTEEGEVALKEFMRAMAILTHAAEEESLDRRAKEMVLKGLKGEKI